MGNIRLKIMLLLLSVFILNVQPVQAKTTASKIDVSITGKYGVIMDMDTGKVLYKKNAKKKCENASTTKLMTAIVAAEKNENLNKKIKISSNASNTMAVKIYMNRGDFYHLSDLMHAMLIRSANDCSVAIAEGTSGSVNRFMKQVNKKAKKIGCKKTHFGTPNGLHTSKPHYTTAYDLALITEYAYNNETIRKILKKKKYSFKSIKGKKHSVETTNLMLKKKKFYCVGKTGNGSVAKYCFTGVYTYEGHSYVIVTLGNRAENGRWSDAKKMIKECKKNAKLVEKSID